MQRKNPHISLLGLAGIFSMLAAAPASAADVAGKWYGKLDSAPVIIIDKTGSGYSGSLVDIDSTRSVVIAGRARPESIHKSLVSLEVVGSNVQFSIRNIVSENGDTGYRRDEYNLNLSEDGRRLIGTVRRTANADTGLTDDHVPMTVTPITLYPTDGLTRLQTQVTR
jgi:hypothetical protein